MYLPLSCSVPQPVKSPRQVDPHLWHPFGQGPPTAATTRPSQAIHRPSESPSKGEMAALAAAIGTVMVHPKERLWYAAQRRIRVATKSIHRPTHRRNGQRNRHRTRHSSDAGHLFPDALGRSRIPSRKAVRPTPEGTRDAICGAREDENPRRYVRSRGQCEGS